MGSECCPGALWTARVVLHTVEDCSPSRGQVFSLPFCSVRLWLSERFECPRCVVHFCRSLLCVGPASAPLCEEVAQRKHTEGTFESFLSFRVYTWWPFRGFCSLVHVSNTGCRLLLCIWGCVVAIVWWSPQRKVYIASDILSTCPHW